MLSSVTDLVLRSALLGEVVISSDIPTSTADLIGTLSTAFTTAYVIAAVVAVAFIIYAGYSIMIAGGDPQRLKKGTDTLVYAIAGVVLVLISGLIFNFVARLLGVENLITVFPTI